MSFSVRGPSRVFATLGAGLALALTTRAAESLAAAGGDVGYGEIDDLSHCYPREINAALLTWLRDTPR